MRSCGSRPLRLPDPFLYSPNPSPDGEPDAADRLRRSGPTCRMAADEGRGAPGGAGAVGRRARGRWTDGQEPSRQARVAHDPRPPPLPAAAVRVAAPERRIADIGDEDVAIAGEIVSVSERRRGRLKMLRARVTDGSGTVSAVWFNQPWLARQLQPGTHVRLRAAGAVRIRRPLLRPERRRRDGGLRSRLSGQRGGDAEEAARARRRGARPRAGPADPLPAELKRARGAASARRRALGAPPSPLPRGGRARPPPAGLRRAARTPAGPRCAVAAARRTWSRRRSTRPVT